MRKETIQELTEYYDHQVRSQVQCIRGRSLHTGVLGHSKDTKLENDE